jgi:hypothetical protein
MKKIVSLSAATLFASALTFAGCKDKQPSPPPPAPGSSQQTEVPNPPNPLTPGEVPPPPAKSPTKKDLS